jgi:signal transduction histidine kinase
MAAFLRNSRHDMKPRVVWPLTSAALCAALVAALHRASRMAVASRELSDRAQAETAAASLMRDHLMASASHDLKTPLASIKLLVHLLQRDVGKGPVAPERLRQRLGLIEANVDKMSSLIGELLDVARLQGGEPVDLRLAEVELVRLVRRVVAGLEAEGLGGRVVVDVQEPELFGEWDASRLERVVTNLLNNAVKYSPAGGDVTVTLGRARDRGRDEAVLAVHDSGIGIPARDLPRLFEWFHRGANVGDIGGTGVGLPSAKLIVEKHGGTIAVHSRPHKGTTVTVRLPLLAAVRERAELDAPMPRAMAQSSSSRG